MDNTLIVDSQFQVLDLRTQRNGSLVDDTVVVHDTKKTCRREKRKIFDSRMTIQSIEDTLITSKLKYGYNNIEGLQLFKKTLKHFNRKSKH